MFVGGFRGDLFAGRLLAKSAEVPLTAAKPIRYQHADGCERPVAGGEVFQSLPGVCSAPT